MNLPNRLTLMRILVIPVMVIIFYIPYLNDNTIFLNISYANFINLILFCLASMTDYLDGYLARKMNLVSVFGKFADPLADKMLVFTAMVLLLAQGVVPTWVVVVILVREFTVSGIRLVSVEKGTVIAASKLAKIKTFTTMVALIVLFLFQINDVVELVGQILLYVATLITIISGVQYFVRNRQNIF